MTHVGAYVGRVAVEERLPRIPAPYDPQGVGALDLHVLEPHGVFVGELLSLLGYLLRGRPGTVIAERSVQHRAK